MSELIFRGGTIVPVDSSFSVLSGDVVSRDGVLVQVGGEYTPQTSDYRVVDCADCVVMPGLVQSHIHMCQTLARGQADNLELLDWLHERVWPYEGSLSFEDLRASADLACLELLLGGTTAILDMGSVHHTDALFEAAQHSGLRATIGKAMMDGDDPAIVAGLQESTEQSIDESNALLERWHQRSGGRLRYAYTPRFALSCTEELLRECARLAREKGVLIHTHTSENQSEIAEVKRRTGRENLVYLADLGLVGSDVCLAHCVWLSEGEREILRDSQSHVLHCPSSNLKLASGYASIPELCEQGISVSLGADGAPCNNNLDGFMEMRLAALIHKPRVGPRGMPASKVVELATRGGARALGLEHEIGSLEVGKKADVIAVDVSGPHCCPSTDPYSTIVYAASARDVRHVAVEGTLLVERGQHLSLDRPRILDAAKRSSQRIFSSL